MTASIVGPGGRIVIPANVRSEMGVRAGSRVEFVRTDGGWLLKPTSPVSALKGIVKKPRKRATIDDMNRAIRRRAGR